MATKDVQKVSDAVQHAEYLINILHGVEYLKTLCNAAVHAEQEVREANKLRDEAKAEIVTAKEIALKENQVLVHQYEHELNGLRAEIKQAHDEYKEWTRKTVKVRDAAVEQDKQRVSAHESLIAEKKEELAKLEETITAECKRLAAVEAKRKELQGI